MFKSDRSKGLDLITWAAVSLRFYGQSTKSYVRDRIDRAEGLSQGFIAELLS